MCSISTRTARTDHSINAHPRAALRHVRAQPSGRYDETGSAASSTNTCRSHEVTGFSAPTPAARQDPTPPSTSWVTSSSTCTSATETSPDAQLIHIREEGVHRAADAADETVTVWSHTGHITVRAKLASL